ncbi:hypothetical protein [Nocardioides sp. CER19]|uniref:hypothetical protein n=1 Tax=Nocardioides sp. CER19 TaxID=3038538 RepID=UPI00244B40C2|nr:hypothetical protein [Nocardioides sp. CER19]MDH2414536.1 hypothetical protein [Nocardioides sp. CER19]
MRHALLLLVPVMVTAGCTGSSDDRPAAGASAPPHAAVTTPPQPAVTCEKPSKRLLRWAGVSVASQPGPITASALVHAAHTSSGDWYVLAVERAYVHDDGSLAGGTSRSLALTNAAGAGTSDPHLIDIGFPSKDGGVEQDWHHVSWTGETLTSGRHAADVALGCLDHA